MLRRLLALPVILALAGPLMVQDAAAQAKIPIAPRPLALALDAAAEGRWENAARIAERDGPVAAAVIEWMRLRAGLGSPREVLAFLRAHPDWPGLDRLRRASEERMAEAATDDILAFYAGYQPQTGTGALSLARALAARGEQGEAQAGIVLAWHTLDLTAAEHDAFLAEHAALLAPHHAARLRMALWRGLQDTEQMLALVDDRLRALARARLDIAAGKVIKESALPEGGARDPGIAYERFVQAIRKGRDAEAVDLILTRSALPDGLGDPERWAGWRRFLARARMREGDADTAYRIAANHQLVEGASYADLEWLSGYLALRYLDAPELALDHFQRFRAAVSTPISLGRAGYWIGRAQDALGDPEAARIAYAFGAQYQTSFYGLLAAERAGLPPDPALAGKAPEGNWRQAAFTRSPLFKAGVLLRKTGRLWLARQFFVALTDRLDAPQIELLGQALEDMGAPHLQVMIGKAAAQRGIVATAPYYPLHPLQEMALPVAPELVLAIARRESEFDAGVQSGAGAQGLMQLMAGTASEMARALGVSHDRRRVLTDWRYNATLGARYLADLAERFDGNVVMIAAGYNAGPGRPLRWIEEQGDPRRGEVDVVDWIEHIPFRETRDYVMRVTESLPVYRARLGRPPLPVPFSEELTGATITRLARDRGMSLESGDRF